MRPTPLAAMAVACVLFLTACGGDGSDPESGDQSSAPSTDPSSTNGTKAPSLPSVKTPDPGPASLCEGIEAEQVSELVGTDLERGAIEGTACTFSDPEDSGGTTVTLGQQPVENLGGVKAFERRLDGFLDGGTGEEVADIGDRAIVIMQPLGSDGLLVNGVALAGDSAVTVALAAESGADEDDSKQQVIELLRIAATVVE